LKLVPARGHKCEYNCWIAKGNWRFGFEHPILAQRRNYVTSYPN